MNLTLCGHIQQMAQYKSQLLYLSVLHGHVILSSMCLKKGRRLWTYNPQHSGTLHEPWRQGLTTSLHIWTWPQQTGSEDEHPSFLLIQCGDTLHCAHITDGTIWATSRPMEYVNNLTVFENFVMGLDSTRTQLVEYELPSFKKIKDVQFRKPIQNIVRPAAHVLILATSGILSQFYWNSNKWGVQYRLDGQTKLTQLRVTNEFVLALNKHLLFILSANGQLLGKVSAVHGHIQDFAITKTRPTGVDLIVIEKQNGHGNTKDKRSVIGRLVTISWRHMSSKNAVLDELHVTSKNSSNINVREFLCKLPEYRGLITATFHHDGKVFRSFIIFGSNWLRTLHDKDFSPI